MPMKRKYRSLNPLEETSTAMVVRAFLAFPLAPQCLWDVGSGTGKVLIESALRYRNTKLIGFEKNPDYLPISQENMERHGIEEGRIEVHLLDMCHDDVSSFQRPDAIYLSCAGSAEEDIIPKLWDILLPGGVIVCNVGQQGKNPAIPEWTRRVQGAHKRFGGKLEDYTQWYDITHVSRYRNPLGKAWAVEDALHWEGRKPVEEATAVAGLV
jgi:precorrin-6B methylase 2